MGREISLFADFSQKENRVTNYCGLIFKMLYEENPNSFEAVINNLLEESPIKVSPKFTQQEKKEKSVPDLCIQQSSFAIYFENKITDWFYDSQLENHLHALGSNISDSKILFLLCDQEIENLESRFDQTIKAAKEKNITVQPITYELLIKTLKSDAVKTSSTFDNVLSEFERYLDSSALLPNWKSRLDAVNCGGTLSEIGRGFYACPDTGGSYKHKRSRYFGVYYKKAVNLVAEIRAVVIVEYDNNLGKVIAKSVKWNNSQDDEEKLKKEAEEKIKNAEQWRLDEVKGVDLQVFLLGNKYDSSFRKASSGGMFGSKQYFEGIPSNINTAGELASVISEKAWEDWGKTGFWL